MSKGKVFLVGAGPGDPRLITVRGLQCIQACDVVVYDRLASPRLLRHLQPGATRIYVGKLPDRHTMKQEEINQLLADLALEGKIVTRLKGGDPTIFGRVGEEAELLRKHGIPYEIVPGITSAIAVPAYAGIPVTHRDLASSMSIITGHESPDKLDRSIKWDKVTLATGTLVFLMGVAKIGYIAEQLMLHGKKKDTPVALIRWGTCPEQETLVGTLETIAAQVEAVGFQPPAVIVVGEVVRQREKLKWAEQRPLFGKRVLVTRARAQASELADRIEALGGEPFEFPVIEVRGVQQPDAERDLQRALAAAELYDWLIFTSVNGVDYFLQALRRLKVDLRAFHKARIAAVGPKTAQALEALGVQVESVPGQFDAEGLLAHLTDMLLPGQHVLLPRGNLARPLLPQALEARGLQVEAVDVYETVLADGQEDEVLLVKQLLLDGSLHWITFTSASTVRNLLEVLHKSGVHDAAGLLGKSKIASIGPQTSAAAREAGLSVALEAENATIESLLDGMLRN